MVVCSICGNTFANRQGLSAHVKIHDITWAKYQENEKKELTKPSKVEPPKVEPPKVELTDEDNEESEFNEKFEKLENEVHALTQAFTGEGDLIIVDEEAIIEDMNMVQKGTWVHAKNFIYHNLARLGQFSEYDPAPYADGEISPLSNFDGNWSDFVNTVLDDYFKRCFNATIACGDWRRMPNE